MQQSENGQSAAKLEWRIIDECSIYEISNTGLVRNTKTNRILKYGNKKRYYTVALHQDGERKDRYVHRLVAQAFLPNPNNLPYVNHLDHDVHNNNVNNLDWCTSSENARHSYENNRREEEYKTKRSHVQQIMTNASKKAVIQYDLHNNLIAIYESGVEASRQTGVNSKGISAVCRGKRKTAGNFIWRFQEGSTTMSEENPSSSAQNVETNNDIV